ncbi:MAG: hypothetical protein V4456_23525 [Bacteroidota bacterium]
MKLTRSRPIKYLLVGLINCLFAFKASGQLIINKNLKLLSNETSVEKFVTANNFDYALVVWSNSNWSSINEQFSCLIKQNNTWYITKILSPTVSGPPELAPLIIKQIKLSKIQADSLINILKPDSAFRYSEWQFANLPDTCGYIKNGKRTGIYGIHDAGTYHLVELSNKKTKTLRFYAATQYLYTCYPHIPEFGILQNFVNTCTKLWKATDNL